MPRSALLSIRMADETREQLEATAEAHGETRSAPMQRYIERDFGWTVTPASCSDLARQDADRGWPGARTFGRCSE